MPDAAPVTATGAAPVPDEPYPRRWLALAVIAVTVLMVILDATIVNIALPVVTDDLGISDADQQWIVTAYTLDFGGLLLLGRRIADFCTWASVLLLAGAVVAALLIKATKEDLPADSDAMVHVW